MGDVATTLIVQCPFLSEKKLQTSTQTGRVNIYLAFASGGLLAHLLLLLWASISQSWLSS
jgi:hypothetical protein